MQLQQHSVCKSDSDCFVAYAHRRELYCQLCIVSNPFMYMYMALY
jgi:hypothetical protein